MRNQSFKDLVHIRSFTMVFVQLDALQNKYARKPNTRLLALFGCDPSQFLGEKKELHGENKTYFRT